MIIKASSSYLNILLCLTICLCLASVCFAQTVTEEKKITPLAAVKRIALVDLNGVLRTANANNRIRKLLDEQRSKFQEEFRAVELDLQQSEKDLLSKRDLLAKIEYEKLVAAFQMRVSELQKEIQYKRQSIDDAYQKALGSIRSLAIEEITKIAGEREIDLILKRDSSIIFLPHLNITDEVLSRLNERTKDARIEVEINKPTEQ